MGRKKKITSPKLLDSEKYKFEKFLETAQSHYAIQTKRILARKKELRENIERMCEISKYQFHPDVLSTRMEDLKNEIHSDKNQESGNKRMKSMTTTPCVKMPDISKLCYVGSSRTPGTMFQPTEHTHIAPLRKCNSNQFITPKVNLSSPVAMLRVPEHGEMALSTYGSPLLVSTSVRDESANINIPLNNGKKMLILPNPKIDTNSIRVNLHPAVREQLETLQKTLSGILQ